MLYRFIVPVAYASPLVPAWYFVNSLAQAVGHPAMEDVELLRTVVKEGVLAILCVLLLMLYRYDRKESEKRLENVANSFQSAVEMMNSTNENIAARLHELTLISAFGKAQKRASPARSGHGAKKNSGSK